MSVDLIPLFGRKFNMFFPSILLITCIFTLCNVYAKILLIIGFTRFEFKSNKKILEEGETILIQTEKLCLINERQC